MKLTGKQAHVLAHVERVAPIGRRSMVRAPTARYQLDGLDCTSQICALKARRQIERAPDGGFIRAVAPP